MTHDHAAGFRQLRTEIEGCRKCLRLVAWREEVAKQKRPAFKDQDYWGRPVPGFGDPRARVLVAGLAPAAHGGNRTGRIFTGDRSGDWLFASLYRVGLANQPASIHRDDGLTVWDLYIAAAVRCAPPGNRPTPEERDTCLPYLMRELELLERLRVVVCLGSFAWDAVLKALHGVGRSVPRPKPRFQHGGEAEVGGTLLLGCYHPSQQNTFTGKLTEGMLDSVFNRARKAAGL